LIERIYWDANVFTYRLARRPDCIQILEHITDRAERGEVEIVTSTFTLVEVCKIEGIDDKDEQERMIAEFFENPYILLQQVDRYVAQTSREIIRNFSGIKPKDAIHIASAIRAGASVLHTYDGNHLIPKSGKIGKPPLTIESPSWKNGQPPLNMEEIS